MAASKNPYRHFIDETTRLLDEGKQFPLGEAEPLPRPAVSPDAPKAVIFSPHPDDECIVGAWPLRLMRQSGWKVVNVAVTQGSNRVRQQERLEELRNCCRYLGFELLQTRENGLENIRRQTRENDTPAWNVAVERIAEMVDEIKPQAILFPHENDQNSTHIGVHWLVRDALRQVGPEFQCFTLETEFWSPMRDPNVMIESSPEEVADLITALSFHVGEVRRNPYHLRTPAWMIDNVRRGGELVGAQGGAPPDFHFATLYRLQQWLCGTWNPVLDGGRFIARDEDPAALLKA